MKSNLLPQKFYHRDTTNVARELLGKRLVHKIKGKRVSGIIVETEAYLGIEDPAAHTFEGLRSSRNEVMYGEGGHAYIYMIYGLYNCINAVTRKEGVPEAVLIRALEPVENIEFMEKQRSLGQKTLKSRSSSYLTSGPGKLCKALDITRSQNGVCLFDPKSEIVIEESDLKIKKSMIVESKRVGIDYAGHAVHWPLRFYIRDNKFISRL